MVNFAITDDSEKTPAGLSRGMKAIVSEVQAEDRQPGNLSGPVDNTRS